MQTPNGAGTKRKSLADVYAKLAVPFIILVNLAVTLTLSYKLNIWVDEAFSLHTTDRGVGDALSQALNFELQAPLYFVLLGLWRKINSSIFFARLVSVICVAIAIKVVAVLSSRFWKDVHPGWIAAAVAFNPLTIYVAVEIRLYALVLLLSALLLLAFYDGYLSDARKRGAQVCYILLAVISLYTHYYVGFLLVANACALLILRRWRPLFEYLAGMAIAGVCFAPMLPFIRHQMSAHTAPMRDKGSWYEGVEFVFWRVKDYLVPAVAEPLSEARVWLLRLCYVAIIWIVASKRRRIAQEDIALWTIVMTLAIMLLLISRVSGQLLLQERHTVFIFLPIIFAAFSIVILSGKKKAIAVWTLIVLILASVFLYGRYGQMAKQGDWQRVAAYLMAAEKPGQAILVFHGGAELPLSRYYSGQNRLVPLPRENTFERFDFHDYILRDEREILAALERAGSDPAQLWLVTDGNCEFANISYNCATLEEFVNKYYTVEETRYFYRSIVRRLQRK